RDRLDIDQYLDLIQRIAEHEARALQRTEEAGNRRKPTAFDVFEQQRRALCIVYTHVDSRHLQIRVYLLPNPDQVIVMFQVVNAFGEALVSHAVCCYPTKIADPPT